MKILLLGHKGMLGHMVRKYLDTSTDYEVYILEGDRFPSDSFTGFVLSHNWDYIINCIGAIPQRTTNFSVNYELPMWLEENSNGEPSSLMNWFLSQEGEVGGYTKAMWNGNTTLTWVKECLNLIHNWDNYKTETILEGECLSKFDLLNHIKEVFEKNIQINPNNTVKINKCLVGDKKMPFIKEQLKELKKYYF